MVWERLEEGGNDNSRRGVGSGRVFGISKSKTQPAGNPSWQPRLNYPSGFTGRQPPTETEHKEGRTGLPTYMHIKWTDVPVHSRNAQHRQRRALSLCFITYISLTWTVESLTIMAQRQGLLFQDRKMMWNRICITKQKLDYYTKICTGKNASVIHEAIPLFKLLFTISNSVTIPSHTEWTSVWQQVYWKLQM